MSNWISDSLSCNFLIHGQGFSATIRYNSFNFLTFFQEVFEGACLFNLTVFEENLAWKFGKCWRKLGTFHFEDELSCNLWDEVMYGIRVVWYNSNFFSNRINRSPVQRIFSSAASFFKSSVIFFSHFRRKAWASSQVIPGPAWTSSVSPVNDNYQIEQHLTKSR